MISIKTKKSLLSRIIKQILAIAVALLLFQHELIFAKEKAPVSDILPQKRMKVNPFQVVSLDLLIPGSGLFLFEKYYWSLGYIVAKAGSAYFMYYGYKDFHFARSLERTARYKQQKEPGILKFQNPKNPSEYLTYHEIKTRVGKAALNLVFAAIVNVVVYSASAVHTWNAAEQWNKNAGPKFKIRKLNDGSESLEMSFNMNF
jgi:hypothetical protein